jgi:hypothetical protein
MPSNNLINNFIPKSASRIEQLQAGVIVTASFAIGAAMLALVLYWIGTNSFEDIETIIIMLFIMLLLAGCITLVKRGQIQLGAWIVIGLIILLNLSNMAWYGIANTSSAAYIIPILLAMFGVGSLAGYGVTVLGCIFVFTITYLASNGAIETLIAFNISTLTFDAPVLSLIYLLVAVLSGSWVKSVKEAFDSENNRER